MSLSVEFLLLLVVNVLTAGIFIGGLAMSIKFIEEQIRRLEEKQDKHNNLIERMAVAEKAIKTLEGNKYAKNNTTLERGGLYS